ncbi:MAG: hypothetical protein RLZZ182_716, partial [Pseudomonadota bacterium]
LATPAQAQAPAQAKATPSTANAQATSTRHLLWTDLTPKDWDPGKLLRERFKDQNLDLLRDDDPKVQALMDAMREMWDTAPVNDAMNGVSGRLPGYIVPLEEGPKGLKEFLLVPYYGACIHSPPPPANQIVHVRLNQPVKGFRTMDTVWVHGTLEVARSKSDMGVSAYRIQASKVEAYTREKPQTAR